MRSETGQPIRLEDYRPPEWLVETVELDIALHPTASRVRATLALKRNPIGQSDAPVVLDGDGLSLVALAINGAALPADRYIASPDRLTIKNPPDQPFRLEIETLIDPSANTKLMGLYRSSGTYCTQCEAEGFRRITYFPDRPDVMAVYTTRIEALKSEAPVLLANGNLIEQGDIPNTDRHFAVWHDPFPKPSYLFALVGGSLGCVEDHYRTLSGRTITLRIYVEPGKESRCAYAMDSLKRSMRWDEETFGREYDLDIFMIVAVSAFNMGAMENKGLNIFNDKYVLASPKTATDADFASIEAIIAHEYFHNWTGNRITCRDWFQLCLKEGLTVFRDQEFSSDQRSRSVKRIADVRALRAQQFIEDAGPLAHPVRPALYHEINNFYTATVYEKGAEIVRMLKTLLGPSGFRAGLDLYFLRHDGHAATVEQFIQCFTDATKTDLSQFMRWYAQAGTPELTVTASYDAKAQTCRLDITQTIPPTPGQSVKQPMTIPLSIGLLSEDGQVLPLSSDGKQIDRNVLVISQAVQSFVLTGIKTRPVLSLNREFSAPIKLKANVSAADLQCLAAHDSDPFNRWQAVQSLATILLIGNVRAERTGDKPGDQHGLIATLAAILLDPALEPAFTAQVLTIPTEADIAREIAQDIDPDVIQRVRSRLRTAIGTELHEALHKIYRRSDDMGPYSPDARSAGQRALKNTSLDLLAATGHQSAIELAHDQYRHADNMTDRIAALATLSLQNVPERDRCFEDFYTRYQTDPLIIDKWFSLQAMAPHTVTLDLVKALTNHPAFSFANPNRVRSLIGAFAHANQSQFNRADGAGYDFVTEIVLALDARNPQVAARLLAAFKSWRGLEVSRRKRAQTALQGVVAATTLSRDVRDIAERSLREADAVA